MKQGNLFGPDFLQCQKGLEIVFVLVQSKTNSLILYEAHSFLDSIYF